MASLLAGWMAHLTARSGPVRSSVLPRPRPGRGPPPGPHHRRDTDSTPVLNMFRPSRRPSDRPSVCLAVSSGPTLGRPAGRPANLIPPLLDPLFPRPIPALRLYTSADTHTPRGRHRRRRHAVSVHKVHATTYCLFEPYSLTV